MHRPDARAAPIEGVDGAGEGGEVELEEGEGEGRHGAGSVTVMGNRKILLAIMA